LYATITQATRFGRPASEGAPAERGEGDGLAITQLRGNARADAGGGAGHKAPPPAVPQGSDAAP